MVGLEVPPAPSLSQGKCSPKEIEHSAFRAALPHAAMEADARGGAVRSDNGSRLQSPSGPIPDLLARQWREIGPSAVVACLGPDPRAGGVDRP